MSPQHLPVEPGGVFDQGFDCGMKPAFWFIKGTAPDTVGAGSTVKTPELEAFLRIDIPFVCSMSVRDIWTLFTDLAKTRCFWKVSQVTLRLACGVIKQLTLCRQSLTI